MDRQIRSAVMCENVNPIMYVSANQGNVEILCCDITVAMLSLDLGPDTTWLGLGKEHVLS